MAVLLREVAKTTSSRNGRPALCELRAEKMGTGVWWDTFYNRLCEALSIFCTTMLCNKLECVRNLLWRVLLCAMNILVHCCTRLARCASIQRLHGVVSRKYIESYLQCTVQSLFSFGLDSAARLSALARQFRSRGITRKGIVGSNQRRKLPYLLFSRMR